MRDIPHFHPTFRRRAAIAVRVDDARADNAGLTAAKTGLRTLSARIGTRARATQRGLVHAPRTLRSLVRADELFLVLLAALLGIVAGLLVVAMNMSTQAAREILYHLQPGERLSAQTAIMPWRAVVPAMGGLIMGLSGLAVARWSPRRVVDPIEANALYGGNMSLKDSLVVVVQTLVSNGFGASVGLEAGFTQIGAAVASRIGQSFRVRRGDLRVLVGGRRRGRHRGRVQRAADRRLLCV